MNKIQKIAGVLSSQEILELINKNVITSENGIEKDLIQPASIDLRLGIKAWRVPASFLPGKGNKVSSRYFVSLSWKKRGWDSPGFYTQS